MEHREKPSMSQGLAEADSEPGLRERPETASPSQSSGRTDLEMV
jgi:hypothetical protein